MMGVFLILLKISSWFWHIEGNIWKYFPRDAGGQGADRQKFYWSSLEKFTNLDITNLLILQKSVAFL
jgi:hypothetical protein